jgi:hypothetical protein
MDTRESKGIVELNAGREAPVGVPETIAYEPPTVTPLGNVHELLAGGGSNDFDVVDECAAGAGPLTSC